jgi:hypothetical protein
MKPWQILLIRYLFRSDRRRPSRASSFLAGIVLFFALAAMVLS